MAIEAVNQASSLQVNEGWVGLGSSQTFPPTLFLFPQMTVVHRARAVAKSFFREPGIRQSSLWLALLRPGLTRSSDGGARTSRSIPLKTEEGEKEPSLLSFTFLLFFSLGAGKEDRRSPGTRLLSETSKNVIWVADSGESEIFAVSLYSEGSVIPTSSQILPITRGTKEKLSSWHQWPLFSKWDRDFLSPELTPCTFILRRL